jgi:hypothetical protein
MRAQIDAMKSSDFSYLFGIHPFPARIDVAMEVRSSASRKSDASNPHENSSAHRRHLSGIQQLRAADVL